MKKITLALTVLLSLGLSACSSQSQKDESAYKGQVIFTDCSYKQEGETEVIVHKYDSTLVTGACVKVSDNGQGVKNVSTWSPRNPI